MEASTLPDMVSRNDAKLKEAIDEFMRDFGLRERYLQTQVMTRWEEIMGTTIARYTTDIYVKGSTLTVYISAAALKQELHISRSKIADLVNEAIGEDIIKEVIVR